MERPFEAHRNGLVVGGGRFIRITNQESHMPLRWSERDLPALLYRCKTGLDRDARMFVGRVQRLVDESGKCAQISSPLEQRPERNHHAEPFIDRANALQQRE